MQNLQKSGAILHRKYISLNNTKTPPDMKPGLERDNTLQFWNTHLNLYTIVINTKIWRYAWKQQILLWSSLYLWQYGAWCVCTQALPANSRLVSDNDCSMSCEGNSEEICGGDMRRNFYSAGMYLLYCKKFVFRKTRPWDFTALLRMRWQLRLTVLSTFYTILVHVHCM